MTDFIEEPLFEQLVKEIGDLASSLCDADIQASMGGLGGCKDLDYSDFPKWQQPYIKSYIENNSKDSMGLLLQAYEQRKGETNYE